MTLAKHWNYGDEDIVLANLKGLVHTNPSLGLIPSEKVVFNTKSDTSEKVTLISGGGAGHEPMHGGFVGDNLLDAAVSGSIFASPATKQILAAIKTKSNREKGTLIITKNYTGDVLHFGLAAEKAKSEGYNVDILFVADDVAVGREQNKMVGRRGLAGTAIMHKVLGAASHKSDLASVAALGHALNASMVTLGASLDRTSVPGKTEEVEFTGPNEAELGLGIHNEPGTKMEIPHIDDLVEEMFEKLVSEDKDRHYVEFEQNDDIVLLVNNIGGTSSLEMYTIVEHVVAKSPLKKPARVLVGDFVTSLNAPGFSITVLNLSKVDREKTPFSSQDVLAFLDAHTNAPGWKPKVYSSDDWLQKTQILDSPMDHAKKVTSTLKMDPEWFSKALTGGLNKLLAKEPKITKYDTIVGDGDCGETLAAGANGILKSLQSGDLKNYLSDPVAALSIITDIVEDNMGGTSGGIYLIFLTALVKHLQQLKQLDKTQVAHAFHDALYDGLFKYTKARKGGRTLVDTLQPFVDSLYEGKDVAAAVKSAKDGCDATKELQAKFGRSSYVSSEDTKEVPDPGAVGLLAIIEGFVEA